MIKMIKAVISEKNMKIPKNQKHLSFFIFLKKSLSFFRFLSFFEDYTEKMKTNDFKKMRKKMIFKK